ncbi:fumarate hydratase [[Eubacterium] cellulosolvens]
MKNEQILENTLAELIRLAETDLPIDVRTSLKNALQKEKSELGKMNLEIILENVRIAKENKIPMCQDTGILNFYIKYGHCRINYDKINKIIIDSVKKATEEIPLRPCVVNPFSRLNTNNNTGIGVPNCDVEIVSKNYVEILVFPKGAGSENMNSLCMLKPASGIAALKKFVLDTVINSGGYPCPPIKIGVGIGGTSDIAMKLSKKALLRQCGKKNRDEKIASLEKELEEMMDSTGIGSMGLGGTVTTLGVNVEYADCHTASLPVGISIQCWADRRASMRLYDNGDVEYLSHRGIRDD